jgi:hypothetical protein
MANAIRAEKGYSVMTIEEQDGKKSARGFGNVIAWEVGGDKPKPITPAGSPSGDYLIVTPEGTYQDMEGRSFRKREEAMGEGKDVNQTGKPKTQQEADQALVSAAPLPVEAEQPLDPSGPVVQPGEVQVDRFNTVSGDTDKAKKAAELRKNAGEFDSEKAGQEEQKARGRPRKE